MTYINAAVAASAAETLDLDLEEVTEEKVSEAYRKASKTCHPNGGTYDPVRWAAITDAKETLARWLAARARARGAEPSVKGACRACGGRGFIQKMQGFYTGPRLMCVMCNGSGNPKKPDREE